MDTKEIEKLCKRCKQNYKDSSNDTSSCRFHPSFFVCRRHDDQKSFDQMIHRMQPSSMIVVGQRILTHQLSEDLHNKKLLQLLVKLSLQLSGFQYSFYDFFSSVQHRVINSKTYTFETGISAYCGTGSINGSDCSANNVCAKPQEYIFFDGKYLTQEANLQVGHLMWGADPVVIGPNNLRELLVLPLDITIILADIKEAIAAMRPRQSNIENLCDVKMESEMENQWFYQVDKASAFLI